MVGLLPFPQGYHAGDVRQITPSPVAKSPRVALYGNRADTRQMAQQGDPDELSGITIPDDARDLDEDRWRYYEELARTAHLRQSPDGPRGADHPASWRDGSPWFGFRGSQVHPLIFMIVAVVAMAASLMLAFIPRVDAPQQTQSLSVPQASVGQVGGLLPPAAVAINGAPRLLRDIRPAVIAIMPEGACTECATTLSEIAGQSELNGVRTIIAGDRSQADVIQNTAADLGVPAMTVNPGAFHDYRPAGVTLLLVAPDGTVDDVVRLADVTTNVSSTLAGWSRD